jgi:hypothetical protein
MLRVREFSCQAQSLLAICNMLIPDHLMREAQIQAEFYCACKSVGLNCALELSTPVGRLDCALFNDAWDVLLAIVECKRTVRPWQERTRQMHRYRSIGVPVHILANLQACDALAKQIKEIQTGVAIGKVISMRRAVRRKKCRPDKFSLLDLDPDLIYRK